MVEWTSISGGRTLTLVSLAVAFSVLVWHTACQPYHAKRTPKALRRVQQRETRRRQKDVQLQRKRVERARERKEEELHMSDEQRREQMERIKMQRVEQYQKLDDGVANGLRVVVDMDFAHKQTERECHSIFKQLGCVYGFMKRCSFDRLISLRIASFEGHNAEIGKQHGVTSWKVHLHEEPVEEIYKAEKIVYLSPDASDVLTDVDYDVVYVVGGIVDRSVRKGQTLAKANGHNIRVVRLPLHEYFDIRKTVLNIDSVLIALIAFSNHRDWSRAFEVAIPKRMGRRREFG